MMKKNIKTTLFVLFALFNVIAYSQPGFNSWEQAKQHPIIRNSPSPDFFEGALIGNGGMGVVVCNRPDAIVLYFGHNNVWDIRVAENNREKIGNFQEIFDKVKSINPDLKQLEDDPWYAQYKQMARENYAKPYPRPFPCGSVILGFDRRNVELTGHSLDISNGLVKIKLLLNKIDTAYLFVFADINSDRVWMKLVNEKGKRITSCFNRINVIPDVKTPEDFPKYTIGKINKGISFKQVLPYLEPEKYSKEKGDPRDKAFSLNVVTANKLEKQQRISNRTGSSVDMSPMEYTLLQDNSFWMCMELRNGLAKELSDDFSELELLKDIDFDIAFQTSQKSWKDFWSKSGLNLSDKELESIWYHNLYFFKCSAKSGVNCPGLFANWSFNDIGTAWHGDWHMNYNTQQPFWSTFSSNHMELNLPYVEMIEFISGVAKSWAKDYYNMRGAFYPHSAYPVEMTMNPYPLPDWGWEVFETPWAVQGVWWHYLYTGDKEFLRSRAFPLMKDAVLFLVDYITRPDAHGLQWGDNNYHIFPTVPPELYRLRPGFKFNSDGITDLTLIKYLFNTYLQTIQLLELHTEHNTAVIVKDILSHFPEYPTEQSPKFGEVFVSVKGESTETVYNAPCNLMTVFPGEDHGLHSDEKIKKILFNTVRNNQNEGGNDLVFQHLQQARLGMLDLDAFKRAVKYCTLENGTSSDYALQVNGRYADNTNFQYMKRMGIWFENFGLPAVINECLLQSYNGIIRMFPNWPHNKDAGFKTLRATGGFLVSSSIKNGIVQEIQIFSENENDLRIYNPWVKDKQVKVFVNGKERKFLSGDIIRLKVEKGQTIFIKPLKI